MNAIGKVGVFFFVTQVLEREHGDALVGKGEARCQSARAKEGPKSQARSDGNQRHSTGKHLSSPARDREALGFGCLLELLRQLRISSVVVVETNKIQLYSMFDLHLAKLMEVVAPARVLREVLSDALGKKNVAGITAIH